MVIEDPVPGASPEIGDTIVTGMGSHPDMVIGITILRGTDVQGPGQDPGQALDPDPVITIGMGTTSPGTQVMWLRYPSSERLFLGMV